MDGLVFFFRIRSYAVHFFIWSVDLGTLERRTGFKIWCKAGNWLEPTIEESWGWRGDYGRARLTWRRIRRGKKVDGLELEGPLVRFNA